MKPWQPVALLLLAGTGGFAHAQAPVCDPATVAAQHLTRQVATAIPWSLQRQTTFAGYHYLDLAAETSPTVRLSLHPGYPNPFATTTTLMFDLPSGMPARLVVHDATGREVARLADGWYPPGRHRAHLAATGWPAGVYLATLTTATGRRTVQLVHVP